MACEKLPYERTWFVRSAVLLSMVKSNLSVPKKNFSVRVEAPLKQPGGACARFHSAWQKAAQSQHHC